MITTLISPVRKPLKPIDVVGNKDLIVPSLQILLKKDAPLDLRVRAFDIIGKFGGNFPREKLYSVWKYLTTMRCYYSGKDENYGYWKMATSVVNIVSEVNK